MALHLGHFTAIYLADTVTRLGSILPNCQESHSASLSKASPILTAPVWPLSEKAEVHKILYSLKGSERRGYLIRQSTKGPSHPEVCWAEGVTERMVECGHRENTSSSSDASGEARSEQGWSVVGPPGKHASTASSLESWAITGRLQHIHGLWVIG